MNIRKWLCELLHCCDDCTPTQPPAAKFNLVWWLTDYPFLKFTGDNIIMKTMQPGQQINWVLAPKGRLSGNPVGVENVTAATDNDSVISTVNADGLSGSFALPIDAVVDQAVAVTATVSYDADTSGDGVNTETLTGGFLIGPEEAGTNNSTLTFDEPVDTAPSGDATG